MEIVSIVRYLFNVVCRRDAFLVARNLPTCKNIHGNGTHVRYLAERVSNDANDEKLVRRRIKSSDDQRIFYN